MDVKPVEIKVDDAVIRGNLYIPVAPAKKLAVLFLHGWTGKPNESAAKLLAENGFHALTISMRGHNNSDGDIKRVTRQNSLDDAVVAYDFLQSKLPPQTAIGVVGNSYGSYITAVLSVERPIACMSLRVPAAYLDDGFDQPQSGQGNENPAVMAWRQKSQSFEGNRGFRAVHNFKGGVQIIEAEHDDAIPHQTTQNYMDAVADPGRLDYHFMKGWSHSIGDNQKMSQEFQNILLAWAKDQEKQV